MAWTDPSTEVALTALQAAHLNVIRDDLRFLHDKGADLASASTITPVLAFHKVTGSTQINNITALAAGPRLTLWFSGSPVLKHANGGGGQMHLHKNLDYQPAAGEVLLFVTDGTDWYQIGAWTPKGIIDAQIAAGAGIAKSKLGALAIVNADVDAAAAIAPSKLGGYPSDGTKGLFGDGAWKVPPYPSLTKAEQALGATTALNASTWTDGPLVSVPANEMWFLFGVITFGIPSTTGHAVAVLWDGTTVSAAAQADATAALASVAYSVPLNAIVQPNTTRDFKISAKASSTSISMRSDTPYLTQGPATYLRGFKLL